MMADMISDYRVIFDASISFEKRASEVFHHVRRNLPVYRTFSDIVLDGSRNRQSAYKNKIQMGTSQSNLNQQESNIAESQAQDPIPWQDIPLMPVRSFRDFKLIRAEADADIWFQSSGTTRDQKSRHWVEHLAVYRTSIMEAFRHHFTLENTTLLCYAPGYSDNPHSSLLWMMNELISHTKMNGSRFLPVGEPLQPDEWEKHQKAGRKIILFGAAFGLMDLAEMNPFALPASTLIIETGGMKTYRREISREKMHETLAGAFGLQPGQIYSEYGMCEMLSQCYAHSAKGFEAPHWCRLTVRDAANPTRLCEPGEPGKIGIIDLANLYSCPFILTEDKGIIHHLPDGRTTVEVLGRWRDTNLRGCNFLIDAE